MNNEKQPNSPVVKSYKGKLGGARPGAGRPRGSLSKTTRAVDAVKLKQRIEEKKAELSKALEKAAMQQAIMRMTRPLIQAQAALARGLTYLYVVRTDEKGRRSKPEVVTDLETIEAYLADELDDSDGEYYYMTTKEPNNEAIKDMLNRAFDKPSEPQDINVNVSFDPYKLAQKVPYTELPNSGVRLIEGGGPDGSIASQK